MESSEERLGQRGEICDSEEQKEVELMGLQEDLGESSQGEEKTLTFQGVERSGVHEKGMRSQKDRRKLGET